jgi:hypothetical protein
MPVVFGDWKVASNHSTDAVGAAGFAEESVERWRVYQVADARAFLAHDVERIVPELDGKIANAFICARKPEAKACCAPTCCS